MIKLMYVILRAQDSQRRGRITEKKVTYFDLYVFFVLF